MKNLIQLEKFTVLKLNFFKIEELSENQQMKIEEAIKELSPTDEELLIKNNLHLARSKSKEDDFARVLTDLEVIDIKNESIYTIKVVAFFEFNLYLTDHEIIEQIESIGLNMVAIKIDNILTQLAANNGEILHLNLNASDFLSDEKVNSN